MIVTLDEFKDALGITTNEQNSTLQSSLDLANAIVNGYIGFDLSDTETVYEYVYTADALPGYQGGYGYYPGRSFVHLPFWPVRGVVEVLNANGVPVDPINYRVVSSPGRVDFLGGLPWLDWSDALTFHYHAGYDPVPADLKPVLLNIAGSIFNSGGALSSSNALKGLTIFDAMNLTFDTGDYKSAGALGFLNAWTFLLDRYRVVGKPVLK